MTPVPGSRFRHVNILYTVLVGMLTTVTVVSRLTQYYTLPDVATWISDEVILYGVFVPVFLTLSFVRETNRTRLIQIGAAMGLGAVVVACIAPRELGGDLNFLLAGVLAYKYGFLRTLPFQKLFLMATVMIVARIAGALIDPGVGFFRVIHQIVITVISVPMLYWLFERDLLQARRENRHLEQIQENNQPFVEFGRNVAGIVHDFKNDLGLFDTFGQYLAISEGDPIEADQIRAYRSYVRRLAQRINRIMMVTQGSHRFHEETGNLQDLVRSTVYVFESNLAFKQTIRFNVDLPEEPILVRLAPAPMISILENLIRNACEALADSPRTEGTEFCGTVSVYFEEAIDGVSVVISDDAGGLPFCARCGKKNCLDCEEFEVGMTTKAAGSGVGLLTVRRQSQDYGFPVVLTNGPGVGLTARVLVVRSSIIDSRQHVPTDNAADVDG